MPGKLSVVIQKKSNLHTFLYYMTQQGIACYLVVIM